VRLGELREGITKTHQMELARRMGVHQGNISRIESRGDMHLSTLRQYIQALGGELELHVVLNERRYLLEISEMRGTKRPRKKASSEVSSAVNQPSGA
jgi:predicted transcriptional regulator